MSRVTVNDREIRPNRNDTMNKLISPKPSSATPLDTKTKTTANNNPELVRKTYYYTNDLIKAISVVAALQGKDKSQLVREILMDSELIKEYIEKIKTL